MTSLEALITAVAQRGSPDLRTGLVHFLQDENMMNRAGGGQVLAHCLTTMPYEETKVRQLMWDPAIQNYMYAVMHQPNLIVILYYSLTKCVLVGIYFLWYASSDHHVTP